MSGIAGAGALHHVGIAVPSLQGALATYRDVLGYVPGPEHTVADQHVRVVFLTHGDSRIELLEPTDATSGVARFLAERGRATMHHLCFEVRDLEGTLARLAAAGTELIDRTPRPGAMGMVAFLHPRATGGVLVELIEAHR